MPPRGHGTRPLLPLYLQTQLHACKRVAYSFVVFLAQMGITGRRLQVLVAQLPLQIYQIGAVFQMVRGPVSQDGMPQHMGRHRPFYPCRLPGLLQGMLRRAVGPTAATVLAVE